MQRYFNTIVNDAGTPLNGALVRVTESSGLVASIYSDNGVTPAANPLVADGSGYFEFYANEGTYTLTITYNGKVVKTLSGVVLQVGISSNSELISFIQAGTGAVVRTSQDKMRETVSVTDFAANGVSGAKVDPTGTIDSTLGIQQAINLSSTAGFVATVPPGTYKHTGLVFKNGSRLRGHGSNCVTLLNTSTVNDSVKVPYFNDGVFFEGWEISGLTITAQTAKSTNQSGLSFDTCRNGIVSDVVLSNHYYNIFEKTVWSTIFRDVRSSGAEYMWHIDTGASTPGVPNTRININGDSCTNGLDVAAKGIGSTVWVGGSIEHMTNWAVRVLGNTDRVISFVGMNFEGNSAAGGFDVVIGDDADATSGPSNIEFLACQFNDTSGLARFCFDLNRGSAYKLDNCNFLSYGKAADLSGNFGTFTLVGNAGITTFAVSTDANTTLPLVGTTVGNRLNCTQIGTDGKVTVYQSSSAVNLLESRRHTETVARFEIDAAGKIGWHPFNTASADVTLERSGTALAKLTGKFVATAGLGVGNNAAATEVIGKAVVAKIQIFDSTGTSIGFLPVYSSIT